jgi:hypothetical protein
MRVKKKIYTIRSLADFFEGISMSRVSNDQVDLYRGHSNKAYLLQPSLFRKKEYRKVESSILRELIAIQPNEFRDDKTTFEQLVRMQHYGLPTRLLDLTYNPLVGLYFACSNDLKRNGELLTFRLDKLAVKYFDSDTISCVANLSNLAGRERDQIRRLSDDDTFNKSEVGIRLLHYIKAEKPYFLPNIALSDLKNIIAVRPKQTNRRILAQQGDSFYSACGRF